MVASLRPSTFKGDFKPTWCPGCGNFGVLAGLDRALMMLELHPEEVVICSGIGCSSRFPFFMRTYGSHSLHGRALAVATGLKVARPELTVVVTIGDGDAVSIGGNHFIHALRRNVDLTCIIMDNQVYGMTKGQTSPTSPRGFATKSTPYGTQDAGVTPAWMALALGATYVAQGTSHDPKQLAVLIRAGIEHKGMAVINVTSPCVTFYRACDYKFYQERSFNILETQKEYDSSDRLAAMELVHDHQGQFPLGVLYRTDAPTFDRQLTAMADRAAATKMTIDDVAETFR